MQRSLNNSTGVTFIEVLIIMIILSILIAAGSRFTGQAFDGARTKASIVEMRNIANILSILTIRGTDSIHNFSDSGSISTLNSMLNATQHIMTLPISNSFGDSYPYYYSLTPTIVVSSTFPIVGLHPLGFSENSIIEGSTSTVLRVYFRSKIRQKKYPRLAWVKQFYYNDGNGEDATLTFKQQNGMGFEANNFLGNFKP